MGHRCALMGAMPARVLDCVLGRSRFCCLAFVVRLGGRCASSSLPPPLWRWFVGSCSVGSCLGPVWTAYCRRRYHTRCPSGWCSRATARCRASLVVAKFWQRPLPPACSCADDGSTCGSTVAMDPSGWSPRPRGCCRRCRPRGRYQWRVGHRYQRHRRGEGIRAARQRWGARRWFGGCRVESPADGGRVVGGVRPDCVPQPLPGNLAPHVAVGGG